MPASRAGKIVRCSQCKAMIKLNHVAESELKSGQPISIQAKLVEQHSDDLKVGDKAAKEANLTSAADSNQTKPTAERVPADFPSDSTPALETSADGPRLEIPAELSPFAIKKHQEQHKAKLKEMLAAPEPVVDFKQIQVSPRRKKKRRRSNSKPTAAADQDRQTEQVELAEEKTHWEDRIRKSNAERVVLARFFALSLCAVAAINLFPAFYYWYDWSQSLEANPLPRWIYLQVFVAAIHLVYAIFLFQIPDWSAMRAVSVAMLAVAFIFGLFSTGLLVGGGQGVFAAFLGLSFVIVNRAAIWCVAMLFLATLMSYLGGRESTNWRRAEQLLEEILTGSQTRTSKA
jgi:hypothetical protein